MNFRRLTDASGETVYINLDFVSSVTAGGAGGTVPTDRPPARSWIKLAGIGSGVSTVVVRETPEDILHGVPVK